MRAKRIVIRPIAPASSPRSIARASTRRSSSASPTVKRSEETAELAETAEKKYVLCDLCALSGSFLPFDERFQLLQHELQQLFFGERPGRPDRALRVDHAAAASAADVRHH